MVSKIWFQRTTENEPAITLFTEHSDGSSTAQVFLISEELFGTWVPDVKRAHD
jgi:hypothetical protein